MASFTKQFLVIVIFLFLLSFKAQTQTLILYDTINLKRGIYRTFKEFRYNFPSIADSFTVTKEQKKLSRTISESQDQGTHTTYHILLPESYNVTDNIWGFCDGKNLYINMGQVYDPKGNFEKIDYLGRYCLFFQWMPGAGGSSPGYLSKRMVNINNGQIYNPDGPNHTDLTTILSKDKGIYDSYKTDKDRNGKSFYYLKLYSEKHKDEIKP